MTEEFFATLIYDPLLLTAANKEDFDLLNKRKLAKALGGVMETLGCIKFTEIEIDGKPALKGVVIAEKVGEQR